MEVSLPANMTDVIYGEGPQMPGVSETLHKLSAILRLARSVIAACRAVLDKNGLPSCSEEKGPFAFTMDPSIMKAFDDMVANYDARLVLSALKSFLVVFETICFQCCTIRRALYVNLHTGADCLASLRDL